MCLASAVPVAYCAHTPPDDWAPLARLTLRAAYDATLLAARVKSSTEGGRRVKVFLTALGGGAFGNRHEWISEAIEHALDAFHIDRQEWSSLAADRAAWRETLRLGHPPGWQPQPPTPPLALRRQTRRAAIDTNFNIDATLRALRAPLPQ